VKASDATTRHVYPDAVVEAVYVAIMRAQTKRPWCVGLSGLQGSGKSTLAAQLVATAQRHGVTALAVSIDDFYFGRAERRRLARDVHPLLAIRGVPGTHDLALLDRILCELRRASSRHPVRVPRFDKGRDTRSPPSRWREVTRAPSLIILEGWCVGIPAQPAAALRRPINRLERDEDGDATWRHWVNAQLAHGYARLWRRLDCLAVLEAPDFAVVVHWRDEQERALRRRHAPHAMTPVALQRFLQHYERLSRYALHALHGRADLRIVLDARRHVRRIIEKRR